MVAKTLILTDTCLKIIPRISSMVTNKLDLKRYVKKQLLDELIELSQAYVEPCAAMARAISTTRQADKYSNDSLY